MAETLTAKYPLSGESDAFVDAETASQKLTSPKSHSLSDLLAQSAASNDSALLESALSVNDPDLIKQSLKRLPVPQVIPLLNAIVSRVQRRPMRALQLIPWLRALFQTHSSYFLTVSDLGKYLEPLQRIIDARTKTFRRMMQLKGRMDMMLQQVEVEGTHHSRSFEENITALMTTPMVTFDEEEDDSSLSFDLVPQNLTLNHQNKKDYQKEDEDEDDDDEDEDEDEDDEDDDEDDEDEDDKDDDEDDEHKDEDSEEEDQKKEKQQSQRQTKAQQKISTVKRGRFSG